jgi:hypothetical protein
MRLGLLAATAALAVVAAAPASATIFIGTGPGVVQPDENVLFNNNPPDGLIVFGITNDTGALVSFTGGETLVGNGGQARLESGDGLLSTTFDFDGLAGQSLGINLVNPTLGISQAEFRVFVGGGTATSLTVTAFDTDGAQFQQTLGIPTNGFFYLDTADDQLIDRFSLVANGTVQEIRQVRVSPVAIGGNQVPEPATWAMMVLGFGAAGALLRRRRTAAFA